MSYTDNLEARRYHLVNADGVDETSLATDGRELALERAEALGLTVVDTRKGTVVS
jgi:hypothetical protein